MSSTHQGVAKPKHGSHLNNKIKQLNLRIDELELLIQSLQTQAWEERRRQEVLLTLLMNQDELQRIFNAGWPAFKEGGAQKPRQRQQQKQQQECGAAPPTWNELLASAPAWQVHRCLHQMRSSDDWSAVYTDYFRRATPLLELALRGSAVSSGGQLNAEAAPAAAADVKPPREDSAAAQRCSPDVAAAARQELQALATDVMQLTVLTAFLNFQPLRDAILKNFLTGEEQQPPPGHWQQVVARLQLTPQQIAIMRFAAQAMTAALQQETEDVNELCSRAASLSLSATVEPGIDAEPQQQPKKQEQQQQQQDQAQPPTSASSSSASPGAAAAARDTPVGLMHQLKRATGEKHLTHMMLNGLVVDCLSPLQWAMSTIAGYPYMSTAYAVSSVAAAMADHGGLGAQCAAGGQPCPSASFLQQDAERHMLQRREQLRQRLQEWRRQEPKHQQLLAGLQLEGAPWLFA